MKSIFKIQNTNLLIFVLSICFLFTSCGDDIVEEMMEEEKNECVSYSASTAENTIMSNWSEANEIDFYEDEIVIPNDAGGGYVKVTLSQDDPNLRQWMTIDTDFEGASIISGSSASTNNEQVREAYFSVHPGTKYSIEVKPFFNADNDDYPVDYTLEWEFFSKVDCWENNDVLEDAKKILLNDINEAYAIAGHISDGVGALDENTYDWYKVEIDTASKLNVEILDLPKDMRISTRWFKADGSVYSSDFEFTGSDFGLDFNRGMTSTNPTNQILDPGTYYIEVHPDFLENGRKANSDLDEIPEHFNKTYKFKVTTF